MSEILIGSTSDPNEATVLPETPEQKAKQLPDPSGYRILCGIPEIKDEYDNGLVKADSTMRHEELLTTVLFVMKMGPDCYKDESRFPSGPWCKEGDFILVRPHAASSGLRFSVRAQQPGSRCPTRPLNRMDQA